MRRYYSFLYAIGKMNRSYLTSLEMDAVPPKATLTDEFGTPVYVNNDSHWL
jgi:hypothetical protein